ncbi:hypothetical protein cyc_02614 [Cyclospora cayetanensis]|uniref:Uncharacterized protein n=1 Tax=Cyclospora cayetanensis TaxID=88456 RepID=A0A1D3D269_9EIME|nr:hypothetical protein cyc_02614 [Cyclospora cayetanensis]
MRTAAARRRTAGPTPGQPQRHEYQKTRPAARRLRVTRRAVSYAAASAKARALPSKGSAVAASKLAAVEAKNFRSCNKSFPEQSQKCWHCFECEQGASSSGGQRKNYVVLRWLLWLPLQLVPSPVTRYGKKQLASLLLPSAAAAVAAVAASSTDSSGAVAATPRSETSLHSAAESPNSLRCSQGAPPEKAATPRDGGGIFGWIARTFWAS